MKTTHQPQFDYAVTAHIARTAYALVAVANNASLSKPVIDDLMQSCLAYCLDAPDYVHTGGMVNAPFGGSMGQQYQRG